MKVGHPLIHLGYAYELDNREVAMEALGLATTSYNHLHKYLDDPSYTKPSANPSTSPLELLNRIHADPRFDTLPHHRGGGNLDKVFAEYEEALLEHWNAWKITSDPLAQFAESQKAATALLVATDRSSANGAYDFFLVHLLTSSHAVRILIPFIPAKFHVPLVRQWWLITAAIYISQTRPAIDLQSIETYNLQGRGWEQVELAAVEGKHRTDAHFVKGLRAMREAERTWGDGHANIHGKGNGKDNGKEEPGKGEESFWLKAAIKFMD